MGVFSSTALSEDVVKAKWKEPYLTQSINRKSQGVSFPGVYRGFNLQTTSPVSTSFLVSIDSTYGDSVAVFEDRGDQVTTTALLSSTQTLSLSTLFPIPGSLADAPATVSFTTPNLTVNFPGGGLSSTMIGQQITLVGFTGLGAPNNGTWTIVAVNSATQAVLYNAAGVSGHSGTGWQLRYQLWSVIEVDYRLGVPSTVSLKVIDANEFVSNPYLVKLGKISLVTGDTTVAASAIEQIAMTDESDQSITHRPWASTSYHGLLNPDVLDRVPTHEEHDSFLEGPASTDKYPGPYTNGEVFGVSYGDYNALVDQRYPLAVRRRVNRTIAATTSVPLADSSLLTGSAASLAAPVNGRVTVTGLTGMTAAVVSRFLVISGATNAANVGAWEILAYVSATSVVIRHPNGVAEGAGFTWTVRSKYFVGSVASAAARRQHFGVSTLDSYAVLQLNPGGGDRTAVTVSDLLRYGGASISTAASAVDIVSGHMDAEGFVLDPIVQISSSLTGSLTVHCPVFQTVGNLEPDDLVQTPPQGFNPHASQTTVKNGPFVVLSTAIDDVQEAIEAIDSELVAVTEEAASKYQEALALTPAAAAGVSFGQYNALVDQRFPVSVRRRVNKSIVATDTIPLEDSSLKTGIGATLSAATNGRVTVTGLSGMTEDEVSRFLVISAATNPANVGVWQILKYVSSTSVVIYHPSVVAEGPGFTWTVRSKYYINSVTNRTNYFGASAQNSYAVLQVGGADRTAVTVSDIKTRTGAVMAVAGSTTDIINGLIDSAGYALDPQVVLSSSITNSLTLHYSVYQTVGNLAADDFVQTPPQGFYPHASQTVLKNAPFITLSTATDDVQEAIDAIDARLVAGRSRVVTVGPAGSNANYEGSDQTPFTNAIAGGAKEIWVFPGTYTFTAAVTLTTHATKIRGVNPATQGGSGAAVIRKGSAAGGGWRGVLFIADDIHAPVFEDLVLEDVEAGAGSASTGASIRQALISGSLLDGAQVRRCVFNPAGTTSYMGTQLQVDGTGTGPGSNIRDVVVDSCFFTQGTAATALLFEDISSFSIRNCSRFGSNGTQYWLNNTVVSYSGKGHYEIKGCRLVSGQTGTPFIGLQVPGQSGDHSVVSIKDTVMLGTASSAVVLDAGTTATNATFHSVLLDNVHISTSGEVALHCLDMLGTLTVRACTFIGGTSATASSLKFVQAVDLSVTDCHIEGGLPFFLFVSAQWFDYVSMEALAATRSFVFSRNLVVGSTNTTNPPRSIVFPTFAVVEGNRFKVSRSSGGDLGGVIELHANSKFTHNYVDASDSNYTTAEEYLVYAYGSTIHIVNNTLQAVSTRIHDTIVLNDDSTAYLFVNDNYCLYGRVAIRGDNDVGGAINYVQINNNLWISCIVGVVLTNASYVTVKGNTYSYLAATEASGTALPAVGEICYGVYVLDNSVVEGNNFVGPDAVSASDTVAREMIRVGSDCVVSNNRINKADPVTRTIRTSNRCSINGNIVYDVGTSQSSLSGAATHVYGVQCGTDCTVSHNRFDGPSGLSLNTFDRYGISASARCTIQGNSLRNMSVVSTAILANGADCSITGNLISDIGSGAIGTLDESKVRGIRSIGGQHAVSGNTISSIGNATNNGTGIRVEGSRNTIVGNTFDAAANFTEGVDLTGSSEDVVMANNMDGLTFVGASGTTFGVSSPSVLNNA